MSTLGYSESHPTGRPLQILLVWNLYQFGLRPIGTEEGLCVSYALTTAGGTERPLDSVLSQGARLILV